MLGAVKNAALKVVHSQGAVPMGRCDFFRLLRPVPWKVVPFLERQTLFNFKKQGQTFLVSAVKVVRTMKLCLICTVLWLDRI